MKLEGKDLLIEYIRLKEKNPKELTIDDKIVRQNAKYKYPDVTEKIDSAKSMDDRMQMVEEYFNPKTPNELEEIRQNVEKKYGISLKEVEYMRLNNGLDVISFYDNKINRKRVIDYSYAKSLAKEFTNIQNNNIKYQTDDYTKNTNAIVQDEANKNSKRELDMVYISDLKQNYSNYISRVNDNNRKKIIGK